MELKDRWIDLSELPKIGKNSVDWENSVGCKINFKYKEIEGFLKIIDLAERKYGTSHVLCEYNGQKKIMNTQSIKNCQIGSLIGLYSKEHKFEVGHRNKNAYGEIEITEKIYNNNKSGKDYKYKCLICGNEGVTQESSIKRGIAGCSVCCGRKVMVGFNDLWSTDPDIAKLLKNKKDGYKYVRHTQKELVFICPDCGVEKKTRPANIYNNKFSCDICRNNDNSSYEKFMMNMLNQLKIKYVKEYCPEWSNNKRYDFFIEDYNLIIEMNGEQHYKNCTFNDYDLEIVQLNDLNKKNIAIENNINNYVIIDCRKDIVNEIYKSMLSRLFNLDIVNFYECFKFSTSNINKLVCDYYSNNNVTVKDLSDIFKIHQSTIRKYLNKGNKFGWCNYVPSNTKIKVICLNTKEIFDSYFECANKFGVNISSIMQNCSGKNNAVRLKDGVYQFQKYDEFLKNPKSIPEYKDGYINKKIWEGNTKKVICITDNKMFNSITEATKYYNVNSTGISRCCRGIQQTTGCGLKFKYYEEEINGLCES